ncbi:8-oxo-dGTP diphosphatase MutT [Cylindrospermopsis raciborskii]|uniref:8-oxo-dGTP diphosphatase MutT n=1 Tax=Cylindrospermopsis raciborskii TaxID=77022 RepID=UPI001BA5FD84|nr:8-oxo-dGTP diphosphatase MutT [Cylindrospermopsis raciborskii]MBU6344135.1 8-oxo-dGTP diphosphatase MutT [Cyanobacteria bacterium REEB494]
MTTPNPQQNTILLHKIIGVGVIWNQEKQILIDRRLPTGSMANLWEFPGGKMEEGETIQDCIVREIREELGIKIAVREHLITIDHTYSHLQVTLRVYHCDYLDGTPQTLECAEFRWVNLDDLEQFEFPAANGQIIAALNR